MNPLSIISQKRDGQELATEEVQFFMGGYTKDDILDYQAAAWLMAIYIRSISPREAVDLTMAMAHAGEILDLPGVLPFALDKHSSGGVGD